MIQTAHNIILQLCIKQLQKTIQQTHIVIIYTYDTNHPKNITGVSPATTTYAYDALHLPSAYCRHFNHGKQIKTNNSGTITTTHFLEQEKSETAEPQTFTYDTPYAYINYNSYGYRYYSTELGRWINRDPIGKRGGINLYAFVDNASTIYFDLIGLKSCKNWSPTGDTRCKYEFARWGTGIYKNYFKCYQYWEEREEKETGTCCNGISERWVFDEEKKVSGYISSGAVIPDTPTEYCKKNHSCP